MSNNTLFRLCYASTATDKCSAEEVGSILDASFQNNVKLHITGALFYDTNYFLQFLEGSQQNINELYKKIEADERHTNLKLLESKAVASRYFEEWSMKYVHYPLITEKFLQETGLTEFNPYLLDSEKVSALAEAFRSHFDPELTPDVARKKTGFEILKWFGFSK